jgi:hypothetical protein
MTRPGIYSRTSPGRSSGRVAICSWLMVPVDAESAWPTRFALRPTVTWPICLSPPAHGVGDAAGARGAWETELGELDGQGDGATWGDAGTLPLGAWATLLTRALDEAANTGGSAKTTAKTKAKTATHTSRRSRVATTHRANAKGDARHTKPPRTRRDTRPKRDWIYFALIVILVDRY